MTITVTEHVIQGIPLIEYLPEKKPKGLTFIQHGYESNKVRGTEYLAMNVARLGYHVVSIDAYKHGDRLEEPFISQSGYFRLKEAFHVIEHTADDILKLFNTAFKHYETFDILGISLGGMVAYLLATKTDKINRLLPIISTPDFHKQAYYAISSAGIDTEKFFTQDKLDYIKSIDPILKRNEWQYNELAIFVSENDDEVPPRPSLKFIKHHQDMIDQFFLYDCRHNVPRRMQEDILSYISGNEINL
ncbi:MAG: hypothetical protein UMR38_04620 [Candidatus Izemoplasma sp.]|nr:hypothetical protein [Candidatus Izemoplasma sp.]